MPEPEQAIVPDDQFAYFFLGRYDEALAQAEDILRGTPDGHPALRIGAASAAFAGQNETAQRLVSHLRSVDPQLRVSNLVSVLGPYKPASIEKYAQGLRLAGLPE